MQMPPWTTSYVDPSECEHQMGRERTQNQMHSKHTHTLPKETLFNLIMLLSFSRALIIIIEMHLRVVDDDANIDFDSQVCWRSSRIGSLSATAN